MFECIKAVPQTAALYMTRTMGMDKQSICKEVRLPGQTVLVQFDPYHRLSHEVLCENVGEKFIALFLVILKLYAVL